MEPLTAGAIAIGTVIATKALEKTGEKVGETLWNKTGEFLVTLKKHSPHTVVAIEKVLSQPLDYGKAVLEVESAAKANPEVNQAVQELVAQAEANPPLNLAQVLQDIAQALKSQSPQNQTWISTIEKIVNFAQRDINIQNQNISI
ncbi:hypothetical protein [Brasilonema bromeliae]|uniref:Uncharacterized protein n=1 Tax=Brasilonema bromeliae SPC951 TaxID=385972 RepID=A0ABX1PC00_9CYAN|nr:hypothetical protein [Brasilonema bromeliae]NMG22002.1 hypothetical protein [Brasilonema bromeliae SPC951]